MAKYSYEFKLSVVDHYLQNIDSFTSTSKKFEVQQSTVLKWVSLYRFHGAEALSRRSSTEYSPVFKRSVIEHIVSICGQSIRQWRTSTFQPSVAFQSGKINKKR